MTMDPWGAILIMMGVLAILTAGVAAVIGYIKLSNDYEDPDHVDPWHTTPILPDPLAKCEPHIAQGLISRCYTDGHPEDPANAEHAEPVARCGNCECGSDCSCGTRCTCDDKPGDPSRG